MERHRTYFRTRLESRNLYDGLKLRANYTATLLKKTGQNNDTERRKFFFENIQPIKYCLRAWFQVIFC